MVTKYRLAHRVDSMPEGTVVHKLAYHAYGPSSQDTRVYQTEYVSVTFKENGDYPSFTVPRSALVEIAK